MVNDYIPERCMIVLAPVLSVYCVYRPDQLKYSNERTQIILSISLIVSIIKTKQQPQETKEELKKTGIDHNTVTLLEVLIILMTLAKGNRLRSRKLRDNDRSQLCAVLERHFSVTTPRKNLRTDQWTCPKLDSKWLS